MAVQDLTGQQFGRLTVVSRAENHKSGMSRWLCRCDCGNTKTILQQTLKRGGAKSCGCLRRELGVAFGKKNLADRSGQRFGRLTVIDRAENGRNWVKWNCICDCGNTTVVISAHLMRGTSSCGCLAIENSTTHGLTKSRTYKIWGGMKERCTNPKKRDYKNYGGRGITICDRWLNNFENFYEDMGECPEGMSIDRIDNNGNYEPANRRWATQQEQCNNQRTNRLLEFDGRIQTLSQWARELDLPMKTLHIRLKNNWSIEKALTTPVKEKYRNSNFRAKLN